MRLFIVFIYSTSCSYPSIFCRNINVLDCKVLPQAPVGTLNETILNLKHSPCQAYVAPEFQIWAVNSYHKARSFQGVAGGLWVWMKRRNCQRWLFFFFNSSDAYEWNRSGLLMCLWDVLGAVSVKPTSHLRSFSFKKLFSGLTPSISLACCRKGVNGEKSNMGECHENEVREWLRGGVPQGREWPRTVLIALESYTQMKGHESRTTASWALVIRPSSFMSWVRHRI